MDIGALLKRGYERARAALSKPEPEPESLEVQLKALLDDYAEKIGTETSPTAKGVWIFSAHVDHDLYRQAIMSLIDSACGEARREGYEAADQSEHWDCSCRCKEHQRHACPICLEVEKCPVHGNDDPGRISPRWRAEREAE